MQVTSSSQFSSTTNTSSTLHRHSLYTPELNLMVETEMSTAIAHEYIWFAGHPLAQIDVATNETAWYFTEHFGTPILQTSATATLLWRIEREPYGTPFTSRITTTRHQPLSFPGQEEELGSDISYNVTRWYRSGWGRYFTPDPLGLGGGTNLYAYVGGNPLGWSDPWGLRPCRDQRATDLGEYDRIYREWQNAGGGTSYGENHIAFAADLWNNVAYSATRGNRGSSCGGRAASRANALRQYSSDCCRANIHDEWRLPLLNSHSSSAPEHPFALIERKCDSSESGWQRVLEYRDTRGDPERRWMTCERFSRNPSPTPRFPHNNPGDPR